jgi:hypothetical protein
VAYVTWLADVLREGGCQVVEQPGWELRGLGSMGTVRGVILHHTGGPANATGTPSLPTVLNGRPGLRGPLSQMYLDRGGVFHVLAAGKCNHAGPGAWQGVTAGNTSLLGIEAENAGTGNDPWPPPQLNAYLMGVAAILKRLGVDASWAIGHKEWALPHGRKVDPTFDMPTFREQVAHMLDGTRPPTPSATVEPHPANYFWQRTMPHDSMLKQGATGDSVRLLQQRLGLPVDGDFGPATRAAVVAFQSAHQLVADGLVGPATWAALAP